MHEEIENPRASQVMVAAMDAVEDKLKSWGYEGVLTSATLKPLEDGGTAITIYSGIETSEFTNA